MKTRENKCVEFDLIKSVMLFKGNAIKKGKISEHLDFIRCDDLFGAEKSG